MTLEPNLEMILNTFIDYFGISREILFDRFKTERIAYIRRLMYFVSREKTLHTFEQIGWFYERDSRTMMYAYNKMKAESTIYKDVKHDLKNLYFIIERKSIIVREVDLLKLCN